MIRRDRPCARGARRAPHGRSARATRPCTALSPPTISRATPCVRASPRRPACGGCASSSQDHCRMDGGGVKEHARRPPARPRPHRRHGDTDRTLGQARRGGPAVAPGPRTIVGRARNTPLTGTPRKKLSSLPPSVGSPPRPTVQAPRGNLGRRLRTPAKRRVGIDGHGHTHQHALPTVGITTKI